MEEKGQFQDGTFLTKLSRNLPALPTRDGFIRVTMMVLKNAISLRMAKSCEAFLNKNGEH